jgi:hypothetical protein
MMVFEFHSSVKTEGAAAVGCCALQANLNDPWRWIAFECDLHALILVGTVLKVHLQTILKLDHDQSIVHYLTPGDIGIHDVKESWLGPLAFLPVCDLLASSEEIHWRRNREIHATEGELKVELTDAHLRGELANNRAQIEIFGDTIHFA